MPVVGFGALIPDALATKQATKPAQEREVWHLDCAERGFNEAAVGGAIQAPCRTARLLSGFVSHEASAR